MKRNLKFTPLRFAARALCTALAAVFALCSFSCAAGGQELHFDAFGGSFAIVQTRGGTLSDGAVAAIRELLDGLENEFSATKNGSTVYRVNSAHAGEITPVSIRFSEIAEICEKAHAFTDGKFDPAVYPLSLLWRFSPSFPVKDFSPPSVASIAETLCITGMDKFVFGENVVKTADNAKIDFGGILKGYAADEIAKIMKKDGITGGFVNVGGSSLYLLAVNNLGIVHPRKDGDIISVNIKSGDLSVSTSGDYERVYTYDGKKYSHIIDPKTGAPSNGGVASATAIGRSGAELDAFTTALCATEHDFENPENGELFSLAKKIVKSSEFSDCTLFIVCEKDSEKQLITNAKRGEDFTLKDDEYKIIPLLRAD
ncbi:MAG: FAD:protein FMN transferase [Clostridia bacterium]|nr:FAD:protein FMN transferase [Clostridia bacterium]